MTLSLALAFAGLCALLALTPGPDTFLVLRFSLSGTRNGVGAAAGSAIGSLVWAGAVAAGLATLLEESATAYRVVKIAGGLYLLYLGLSALVKRKTATAAQVGAAPSARVLVAVRAGLLSTVLNPKVGLFFVAVVPQFASGARIGTTMALGVIDAAVALTYLVILSFAAARAVGWLRRPRVTKVLDRVSAAVIAAFGIGTLAAAK